MTDGLKLNVGKKDLIEFICLNSGDLFRGFDERRISGAMPNQFVTISNLLGTSSGCALLTPAIVYASSLYYAPYMALAHFNGLFKYAQVV